MAWKVERSRRRAQGWRVVFAGAPDTVIDHYRALRHTLHPGQIIRVLDDSGHTITAWTNKRTDHP